MTLASIAAIPAGTTPAFAQSVKTSGDVSPVLLPNPGSSWSVGNPLFVGETGSGALAITNGGSVSNTTGYAGLNDGSTGVVTVDGAQSTWTNSGNLFVGYAGSGMLAVTNGGSVSNATGYVGRLAGATGMITVDGAASTWTSSGTLNIGTAGSGTLAISNGGGVSNTTGYLGLSAGSTGAATVDGAHSTWANSGNLHVGYAGSGMLLVSNGGSVSSIVGSVGEAAGSTGTATVDGAHSTWTNSGDLHVGNSGSGTLNIVSGGSVSSATGLVGTNARATGAVTVDGASSAWTTIGSLYVGYSGSGTLTVTNGGGLASADGYLGRFAGSTGAVTVDGPHSSWVNGGGLSVGSFGSGTLSITRGGSVSSADSGLGINPGSTGTATVDGAHSIWSNSGSLNVGYSGSGTLEIRNGGAASSTMGYIALNDGSTGMVTVDGPNSSWTNGSLLYVGNFGTGTLAITHGGSVSSDTALVGVNGGSTGTVAVDGTNSTWTSSGNLHVGYYGRGTLTIANGGSVSNTAGYLGRFAGSTGTATVDGANSTWTNGSLLFVGYLGNGTLSITNGGSVSNTEAYIGRFASSTATVTVDGAGSRWTSTILGVGHAGRGRLTIADGGSVSSATGLIGFSGGSTGAVTVDGAHSTWTNIGNLHVGYSGAGTLTIANGGSVSAAGITIGNFAGSTGALNIGAAAGEAAVAPGLVDTPTVSFGAGTGSLAFNHTGAAYMFAAAVGGAGAVHQLSGTTILTGTSTYTGGTTISGGTLQLGHGGTRGSIVGDVANDGVFAFNRSDAAIFSGAISGSGAVRQIGPGTTILTGTNTYAGGTTISAGTLQIGNGGATGWIAGDVANDGVLAFNRSDVVTFSGAISGSGAVHQIGPGTTVLTGSNSYAGGTTISSGTLQLGNGGAAGSITSDVVNDSVLTFNRSDAVIFSGAISGSGGVRQIGTGTTILTGTNAYTGGTTITAGTLQIGNGSAAGSIAGDVANDGVLAFNRAGTLTLSGAISGSGAVRQIGTGTTILTGANSYTGGTTVSGGRLQFGDGSNILGGDLTVTGGTLAIQAPATVNVAQAVTFADNTALSIGAGTNGPALSANSVTIGNGVALTIGGIDSASPTERVLIDTRSGISGDFASIGVGGPGGPVDYLAVSARKSADSLQYLASYGLSWLAGNNLAHGTFTLTEAGDSFTVGTALTDQAANAAAGWNGTSLTKAGAGTLILTGANAYTGGTTISGGTLQIGNGGTSGSILGDVVNDGVLAFNRSDAVTFPGTISGSGAVHQIGSGKTILTGTNSYAGGTVIAGGVLSVSRDANLGASPGGLTFTGGTLATTASFDTARPVALVQAGAFDVADSTELGLTGVVTGGGDLVKLGNGTLRLGNGANAYHNTFVAAGTLIGNAGSISGHVANAGTVVFDQGANASFGGDLGALNGTSGAMVKRGSGALTLTGVSGLDWSIEAGSLTSSAERFRGRAAIASGASFTLDQAVDAAYAGTLSGAGSLHKTGSGLLDLPRDSSAFTGSTFIENGTLAVNGRLGGTLDVLGGGRLQGTGTVGNTVVSGTIAPGNSIGTLTVAGAVVFNAGAIYEVEVDAAGRSDMIAATGAATINGGTVQVLGGTGTYAPKTTYTILTANGGRAGTFTGGVTSNLAFLTPSLSYDADSVYLTMIRNDISFHGISTTPNQIAIGGGIESPGLGNPVYAAVVSLSAAQAQHAFDQLSGEIHASARTALIEDGRFVRNAVNDRVRAAFGGVGASGGLVVAYVDGKPVPVPATAHRLAVWGQAFGSWGHTDGDGNAARLNRRTGGFILGVDAPVFDTWRFGAIAGYSRTDFDTRALHSAGTSDNYHLGLYGGTRWGDLAFRTGAAYTWHDVSTSRSVLFPGFGDRLKARYDGGTAQVFGELAYRFHAGGAGFEPFASLAYVNLSTSGFREADGAAALTGAAGSTDAAFTTLGLRAATSFSFGDTTTTLRGMAGWRHAYGTVAPGTTMRLAGGHAFEVGGVPIARDAAVIEVGLDHAITPNATLGVTYGGQFGPGLSDRSFRANFNVRF